MNWPEIACGQVEAVHPEEFAVSVLFPQLGMLTGIRVPVAPGQASRQTGTFALPQRGDWGIVAFYQNDARSARWLTTMTDAFHHAAPLELLTQDPDLRADFTRSGREVYEHGNGDIEVKFGEGSLFRITHGDDYKKQTERKIGVTQGDARSPQRVAPSVPGPPSPPHVYFKQKDLTEVHLDDQGTLKIELTGKYRVRATNDGEVQLRNGAGVEVTLTPTGQLLLGPPGDRRPVAREGDKVIAGLIVTSSRNVRAS